MALSNLQSRMNRSPVLRYGFSVISLSICLGLAFLAQGYHFRNVEFPLLLFAVAITAWYAGSGPAVLSVLLSIALFAYFFAEPRYSFRVYLENLPYFILFVCFASLVAWFASVRRRVEEQLRRARSQLETEVEESTRDLRQARNQLQLELEERTRQARLLGITFDAIMVLDANDVIIYWNRAAQELYGFTPEEAIGSCAHDLFHTVFPVPLEEVRGQLRATGRWEGELRHSRADGSELVVLSRWSLERDESGQPVATLESNNDITQRKRREDEIRELNEELAKRSAALEVANKELEAFAYSVSHDLRAPLRHMSGYAELLQKKAASDLDDKSRRYVTMILEAAGRMGNLIDDLLAFSRIGRAETQKTLVNLDQLVTEALSELRLDPDSRIIDWKIKPLPVCYGDRSMLKLVLINLLSNAVKFTRNRPRAEIEIACAREDRNEVSVFVRDNGAGFDMKYVHKLFGVFQRLHQSDAFEGTGIGLATVQRVIHRHGGSVRAEGAVDQGATFYFSLPKS